MDTYREPIEDDKEKVGETAERFRPETKEKAEKLPVEEEILELEKRLAEKKKELGQVKKLEGAVEKIEEKAPKTVPVVAPREEELTEEEKLSLNKIKLLSRKEQLNILTKTALGEGLVKSIKIARALNNAYLLDELHDTLIDKLYKELVKKGEIKE